MDNSERNSHVAVLAAGVSDKKISYRLEDHKLPQHVRVDEAVVSIARAAFSAGARLLIPYDEELAPLIVHVAGEYLAPRYAEGGPDVMTRHESKRLTAPVSLFRLMSKSEDKRGRSRRAEWMNLPVELGLVSPELHTLETLYRETEPDALVVVGEGRRVKTIVEDVLSRWRQMPIYALRTCGEPISQAQKRVIYFDDLIIKRLEKVRHELTWLSLEEHDEWDVRRKSERKEPPRFQFVPYAMISQLLVHKMFGEHQKFIK